MAIHTKFTVDMEEQTSTITDADNGDILSTWAYANEEVVVSALSELTRTLDEVYISFKQTKKWHDLINSNWNPARFPARKFKVSHLKKANKIEISVKIEGELLAELEWVRNSDEVTLQSRNAMTITWADYTLYLSALAEFFNEIRREKLTY